MLARLVAVAGAAAAASAGFVGGDSARAGCSPNLAWQDRHPSWASTLGSIAFQREEVGCAGAPNTVRSVSPTGTQPRSLGLGIRPSARGDLVAFEHAGRIEVATTRGQARRTLTTGRAPAMSPQRDRIAFLRDEALWVMNLDGFGQRRLADAPSPPTFSQAYSDTPAWSPVGSRIAFVGPGAKLFVVPTDGSSAAARVTAASGREVMPSWSHDGTRVAFAGDRAGNWDVYVTEAGGGTPFPVAAGPSDETLPSWSPVADRIAFVRIAAPEAVEVNLWTVSSSGGDERPVGPDAHAFSRAAWAPDGRALAYAAGHECQRWGIYVAAADGGGARRITNHCRFTGTPAADVLRGTDFLDFLDGLGGDDRLYGGGSRDQISGGAGNDLLDGDGGYDTLLGGPGADVLIGRGDPDVIVPGPGADRVFAGPSRDSVDARDGARDVVDCGTGWGVDRVAADRVDVVRNCEIVRRA